MFFGFDHLDCTIIVVCFVVSILSPSIGTSGGVTFAVMATVMPPSVVVPIHALIESVASLMRWSLLRKLVNYKYLLYFSIGVLPGLFIGWPLIGLFPEDILKIILGSFFLITTWLPVSLIKFPALIGGLLTSCLTIIVGATGPLVTALIARSERDHHVVIATQGACTTFQHFGKAVLFSIWGFSFAEYFELIAALIIVSIIGVTIGKKILFCAAKSFLSQLLKLIVTLLGIQLLLAGVGIKLSHVPIGSWFGGVLIIVVIFISCYITYSAASSRNHN